MDPEAPPPGVPSGGALRAPPPGTASERPLPAHPPDAPSGHALWAHPAGHTEFAPGGVSATRLFWAVFPYIYLII